MNKDFFCRSHSQCVNTFYHDHDRSRSRRVYFRNKVYTNALIRHKISRNTCRSDPTRSPSDLDRLAIAWCELMRGVLRRFYGPGGELLSILIDANYRRVRHAAVCRTRARCTVCAARCNGAPRCNDATVLRVNSWRGLDNGARIVIAVTLSADPERIAPVFASGLDPRRLALRIEHTTSISKHQRYSCAYSDRRYRTDPISEKYPRARHLWRLRARDK